MSATVFLLSPASCAGRRTEILLSERASFPLAVRLREGAAPLGEVFSFLSGLYFRGKLTYAQAFATAPAGAEPALVITTHRGLLPSHTAVTAAEIRAFGAVPIDAGNPSYRAPLEASALALRERLPTATRIVLLGSIATGKYTEVLQDVFGERLLFPELFIGRGDMSRGGLLLRAVDAGRELAYIAVRGAPRRGSRPPKLAPRERR